ncbi:mandelate racemase/muconate lactonizing enzyme family protein [Micromonospora sp. NPDC047740]|uniref:mandelate racemase/muconate lactonizing enzyme family protein n=1 Tax=Micromonospora sp. NPDC047740 TaxID=3364254 RepID=UPI00371F2BD5
MAAVSAVVHPVITVRRHPLVLASPLRHASADLAVLDEVFVRVQLDRDTVGWAEVRGNGGYATGETAEVILAALGDLPQPSDPVWRRPRHLLDSLRRRSRLAAMALDVALRDAHARQAGQPLHVHLGAPAIDRIPTHAQVGFGTAEDAYRLAADAVAAGFTRLKVRVGSHADPDRLAAVRDAAGPNLAIIADANGAWTVPQASAAMTWLAQAGVAWIEQPVPPGDDDGLAEVRRRARVPVYADESARDADSVRRLADRGCVDGVHLKLEKCGTVDRLAEAVETARARSLQVALGQMDQGRLGCAATAQLAPALGVADAELWGCASVVADVAGPLCLERGAVLLPSAPGLGVEVHLPGEEDHDHD